VAAVWNYHLLSSRGRTVCQPSTQSAAGHSNCQPSEPAPSLWNQLRFLLSRRPPTGDPSTGVPPSALSEAPRVRPNRCLQGIDSEVTPQGRQDSIQQCISLVTLILPALYPWREQLIYAFFLIAMLGIYEHDSYHVVWIHGREDADVIPTERMSNHYEGSLFARSIQERPKFLRDLQAGSRLGPGFAPTVDCPVVRTNARKLCNLRLNHRPASTGNTHTAVQNYGWAGVA
jgi:hypothetical protein